jgi:translation initiation factor 2 subunit 2
MCCQHGQGPKRESCLLTSPQSHSPSTEPLSETLASTNPSAATAPAETENPAPEAGEDGLDLGLMKKKKKKAVKIADDAEPAADDAAAEGDGALGI